MAKDVDLEGDQVPEGEVYLQIDLTRGQSWEVIIVKKAKMKKTIKKIKTKVKKFLSKPRDMAKNLMEDIIMKKLMNRTGMVEGEVILTLFMAILIIAGTVVEDMEDVTLVGGEEEEEGVLKDEAMLRKQESVIIK